jgi:hypothetical protein
VTLSFVNEKQFLTVIQPVHPLHECANPAPTESTSPAESVAAKSTTEPLHSAVVVALTETS